MVVQCKVTREYSVHDVCDVMKRAMQQSELVEGYWFPAETWGCGLLEQILLQVDYPQSVGPKHIIIMSCCGFALVTIRVKTSKA